MGRLLAVCTVSVLVLAAFVYEPVPEGWKQPWTTRMLLAGYGLQIHLGNAADALGYNGVALRRYIMDTLTPYVVRTSHLAAEVSSEDTEIAGVPVRRYAPQNAVDNKELPAVIFYHGGGWTVGSVVTHDNIVRRMVKDLGIRAISVGYRLSPEYRYPVPFEDSVQVTKYVLSHAKDFFIDSSRVALAGDSAGGNFAAAISIRLRDDKFPVMPKLQVLIYPCLQLFDLNTPSYQANRDGPLLTTQHVGEFIGNYLQGHDRDAKNLVNNRHVPKSTLKALRSKYLPLDDLPNDDIKANYNPVAVPEESELWKDLKDVVLSPYASPLAVDDLSRLPFAYIMACESDVLRDDGIWFAKRLGTEAHLELSNCFHGSMNFAEDLESALEILQKMNQFIGEYL